MSTFSMKNMESRSLWSHLSIPAATRTFLFLPPLIMPGDSLVISCIKQSSRGKLLAASNVKTDIVTNHFAGCKFKVISIPPVFLNLHKSKHNMYSMATNIVTTGWIKKKARAAAWRKSYKHRFQMTRGWPRKVQEAALGAPAPSSLSSTMPTLKGKKSWRSIAQGQNWNSSTQVWKETIWPKLLCPGH